jgi:hypothetical protein
VRVEEALTARRWRSWPSVALIAVAVIAGSILARMVRLQPREIAPQARYDRLADLPVALLHSVALDLGRSRILVTGPDPYIVLQRSVTSKPVSGVQLRLRPVQLPPDHSFVLYFLPQDSKDAWFSERWTLMGDLAITPDWWLVRWSLPTPARETRLDFPEGGEFEFAGVAFGDDPAFAAGATGSVLRAVLVFATGWLLVLLAIQRASGGRLALTDARVKQLLLLSLAMPIIVLTFLMPPFQGPDEDGAWKLALVHYRPSIRREPVLFYLPDLLDAIPVKFHPGVHENSDRLRWNGFDTPPPPERLDLEYHWLQRAYKYGNWYAYPTVWVVGLFYPAVGNVQEALVFFYLCRLTTGILLLGLLELFRRRFDLPYVAIAFFALPLVGQQFVVVSVDTMLNLGTIVAVMLFLQAIKRPSVRTEIALAAIATAVSLVKFTFGGLLLLPIALLVRRRPHLHPALWIGVLAAAVVALPVAVRIVLALSRDAAGIGMGSTAAFDGQVAALSTWHGWRDFLAAYWWFLRTEAHPATWAGPLGWLDTAIGLQHATLITGSLGAALAFDLWNYRRPLLEALRSRRRDIVEAVTIIAGAFLIVTFVNSLLLYVMTTPPGAHIINGVQGRHVFYAGIVAVLLPMWIVGDQKTRPPGSVVGPTASLVTLGSLLAACSIELTIDLLTRYW